MDDRHFETALAKVLNDEGGYVNDARDKGGETKYGISKRSYPNLNIKTLTRQDAVRIYKTDFWDKGRYGTIENRDLACLAFALGVQCGPSKSIRMLQGAWNLLNETLFALAEDGVLGPKTANAVNSYRHPKALKSALKRKAQDHFIACKQPEYLAGRFNRLEGY